MKHLFQLQKILRAVSQKEANYQVNTLNHSSPFFVEEPAQGRGEGGGVQGKRAAERARSRPWHRSSFDWKYFEDRRKFVVNMFLHLKNTF